MQVFSSDPRAVLMTQSFKVEVETWARSRYIAGAGIWPPLSWEQGSHHSGTCWGKCEGGPGSARSSNCPLVASGPAACTYFL